MLLIAGLSGTDAEEAKIAAEGSIDAGLIWNQDPGAENVERMLNALGDVPLGVFVKDASTKETAGLARLGWDFMVFDMKASVVALEQKELGKILLVETSVDPGLVRAISNLDIDGVLVNRGQEAFVTVEYLLACQRFSLLLDKPVMAALPSSVTGAELRYLRGCGISGIVVPSTQPAKAFAELRKTINDLPAEIKRPRTKADVVLPKYEIATETEEEEEEEET